MAIIKWIELSCDKCGDVVSGLRWQSDINGNGLREEGRLGGWVRVRRDGEMLDLCAKCKDAV